MLRLPFVLRLPAAVHSFFSMSRRTKYKYSRRRAIRGAVARSARARTRNLPRRSKQFKQSKRARVSRSSVRARRGNRSGSRSRRGGSPASNDRLREIEAEIRRRLVADRGVEAMAKTLRKPLPEDVDFMHASREEMVALRRAIWPLTRKLAVRLARKRRHGRKGPLDFRRTVRHSLSYGGVPAEPKFKYPKPSKPEIMVIADISGSVAAFARFTLHLVYALNNQFSKVRSFVFIDGLDEVTDFFENVDDITEAIHRVNTEADVIWVDGHSDYGHAFEIFDERFAKDIGPKTTVIILGDARNNYHASQSWVIKNIEDKARKVFWLNPEPKSYWDTGDSIVGEYSDYCNGTFEVRNLKQLEAFVENLV